MQEILIDGGDRSSASPVIPRPLAGAVHAAMARDGDGLTIPIHKVRRT
jgi:hypothetical protein